jgi:hypothetical protein
MDQRKYYQLLCQFPNLRHLQRLPKTLPSRTPSPNPHQRKIPQVIICTNTASANVSEPLPNLAPSPQSKNPTALPGIGHPSTSRTPSLTPTSLPTNKTDETKSTASSTKFTVSEDYKSIIEKEMALYKTEAAQARSDLINMKTEISYLVNQTIQQSLKGIIQEVHNQSASTFLTSTEYRKDMTDFHDEFKKQTKLTTTLSKQIKEMQNPTPRKQRPTKKAHLASDVIIPCSLIIPRSLNSSFESHSPRRTKSPFSSSQLNSTPPSQTSPIDEPLDSPIHMLE